MPILSFTRDEVEAKAGVKPWKDQVTFHDEINPDEMADTAAVYARAAGEASDTGELATEASHIGADAGGINGEEMVDDEGRIDLTSRGLQGNGEDMDTVVEYVVRAMNRALDADEEVHDVIFEPANGLDKKYTDRLQDAIDEWNGWQSALEAKLAPTRDLPLLTAQYPVSVEYGGETRWAIPMVTNGKHVYSLPAGLDTDIRNKHLALAAGDAKTAAGDIDEAIEAYRKKLGEYGQELGTLGYDLSDGPLGLWTTDGMADYAAEQVEYLLAHRPTDPAELDAWIDQLDMWTEGLGSIALGIENPDDPDSPLRDLTAAERAYLEQFLGHFDKDEIVALGELVSGKGLDPGDAGRQFSSLQRIANGFNMLFNPEIGGVDISTQAGRDALPPGLKHFLDGPSEALIEGMAKNMVPNGGGPDDSYWDALKEFNAFGELMGTASIAPGHSFGSELAHEAVTMQHLTQYQYVNGGGGDIPNTGSNALLQNVALNSDLSADLLNDKTFREDALTAHWENSDGLGNLIRSGTTVPEGVGHNDPEAKQYVQAAFNVLHYAAMHPDTIHGTDHWAINEYGDLDHSGLEDSIGDTMLNYMDFIAKGGKESEFSATENGFTDENLQGLDYKYSFDLSDEDRNTLFKMMNTADSQARDEFYDGVNAWYTDTALGAFNRLESGESQSERSTFDHIGRVAGTARWAQDNAPIEDESKRKFTTYGAISTGSAMLNTVLDFGKWNVANQVAAFGITEAMRYGMPDGNEEVTEAQWDTVNWGDSDVRAAVAQVAQRAGYEGADQFDAVPDPAHDSRYTDTDMIDRTRDIEKVYLAEAESLITAYDRAVHDDQVGN
ncbi:hypothetical protein [Streptomyces sp. RFCAC02]|uniref:TPR repeat region-containing protein n=1 Tax=Streptomyces sp. RFCAC02 TaxID=2499143 RepID=UPI00102096AA|nr:hypothetical protein [Streptomyces sp. RFCAC02]